MSESNIAPIINLYQARAQSSPSQTFLELAAAAERLYVTKGDVYGDLSSNSELSSLRAFEAEVAQYLGKSDALFLPSGTMAQNIVLAMTKSSKQRSTFLVHYSSHLLLHEQQSYKNLVGMEPTIIEADPYAVVQEPVTLESFQIALNAHLEKNSSPPAVAFLECPHREVGGKITSIEDIAAISQLCKQHDMHFHMDGARIWEATAAYPSITDVTKHFDSLYVSFYKGLGGLTGAMLLGDASFIAEARIWLRRFGGNLYTQVPYHVSAWQGFRENKDAFPRRKERFQEIVSAITDALRAKDAEHVSHEPRRPVIRFDPAVPIVPLIHVYLGTDDPETAMKAIQLAQDTCQKELGRSIRCLAWMRKGQFGASDTVYTEMNLVSNLVPTI